MRGNLVFKKYTIREHYEIENSGLRIVFEITEYSNIRYLLIDFIDIDKRFYGYPRCHIHNIQPLGKVRLYEIS